MLFNLNCLNCVGEHVGLAKNWIFFILFRFYLFVLKDKF